MKTNPNSTPQQISEQPWVDCPDGFCSPHQQAMLTRPRMISDVVKYYAQLEHQSAPGKAVFHSPSPDGYPKYLDRENDPYCRLKQPNPPTPEAVAKAQFVDKTYQWKGK